MISIRKITSKYMRSKLISVTVLSKLISELLYVKEWLRYAISCRTIVKFWNVFRCLHLETLLYHLEMVLYSFLGNGKKHIKKTNANENNKKAEETDVHVKGIKETDKQWDDVPLIILKSLIPKGNKRNREPRKKRTARPDGIPSSQENLIKHLQKDVVEEVKEKNDDDEKAKSFQEEEAKETEEVADQANVIAAEQPKTEVVV
ncbi:hypothetical protein GIB67_026372 [Kingdonia uniflora]|uniref:Uncharacterized protein n=1 Tax=Kingdonia uniflora TaxID=39325 RepID=A0A7J7P6W8_9MAGN|nr:hypothetical protein GIB67_026372 [Kingdonia uniflora]